MIWTLLLLGCREPSTPAEPEFWPGDDSRPALEHSLFAAHDLPELSLYATHVTGPVAERPDFHLRGPFGVGNRAIFGMVGLDDPVNAIHGIAGPTYSLGPRFFKDQAFVLEVDGAVVDFEEAWVARPRATGLVVTRADAGGLSLYTLDFAPQPDASDPWAAGPPVWVRRFGVRSHDDQAHTVRILGGATTALVRVDGRLADDAGDRILAVLGSDWDDGGTVPVADLGTVEAGGEAVVDLVLGAGVDGAALDQLEATLAASDLDAWLDSTLSWWSTWAANGVQLTTSDPRWADLIDANRVAIAVQTTEGGGISPMSRYTRVWLRDTYGATRFLARSGLHEDAQRSLRYMHACHVASGDYGNSCSSEVLPDPDAVPPDWANLPELGGRTAAEGPGYIALAADHVARWTGDTSVLEDEWDWVARGVLAQQMEPDGRQTFSGDETFRLVMGAALGYPLEYDFPGLAWSTNSSLVMEAAATRLAEWAPVVGRDPAPFLDRAQRARGALESLRQAEGHYAALEWHTAGSSNEVGIERRPFEDVNLKELWLGVADPSDPLVLANLEGVRAQADRGDGDWVSPMDPALASAALPYEKGVLTGMNPGFALFALTAVDDPDADLSFDAMHRWARTSGSYPEDSVLDDHGALHIAYDRNGVLSDISARYRPWEGGINADAVLSYLIGAEPLDPGVVRLHPHLPNGQGFVRAEGVNIGGVRLDLEVTQSAVRVVARDALILVLEDCEGAETLSLAAGEVVVRRRAAR